MEETLSRRKRVTIVTGCYNERDNIADLYARISAVMQQLVSYEYEVIIIDNASVDGTQEVIRDVLARDKRWKAIFNIRNFGHVRSGYHAFLQADGDVVVAIASDLEDPPELIPSLLEKWELGAQVVAAVRRKSEEKGIHPFLRRIYYKCLSAISEVKLIENFTGFGAYDKKVIELLRKLNDPYPYLRGLISELGFDVKAVEFDKPYRKGGVSKGRFYVYFDYALLGLVNHSKLPLRLSTMCGAVISMLSFIAGFYYLIRKLAFWDSMQVGIAPVAVGMFFILGILLLMIGILGEYVALVVTHTLNRPLVVEKERVNW
jgi:glycosyltransferase involved in cell wall biosynthesis